MTTNAQCSRCEMRMDALTFRCWNCQTVHHVHNEVWHEARGQELVMVLCPQCNASNALAKPFPQVLKGRKLIAKAIQPELVS